MEMRSFIAEWTVLTLLIVLCSVSVKVAGEVQRQGVREKCMEGRGEGKGEREEEGEEEREEEGEGRDCHWQLETWYLTKCGGGVGVSGALGCGS